MKKVDLLRLLEALLAKGIDFTDVYLVEAAKKNYDRVASFDKDLKKLGAKMFRP